MYDKQAMSAELKTAQAFFAASTKALDEADASFAPAEGAKSVVLHFAHVAYTIEWYLDGAFSPMGMDTNWEAHRKDEEAVTSLAEARQWIERAFARAQELVEQTPPPQWLEPIHGAIMTGAPRGAIISGIVDHTAHHRGALAVYTRLLGKTPPMPYL